MTPVFEVTFCGRAFTAQEVELMRTVAQDYAGLGVTEIARTICELLDWKRPNGGLKNHECRQLLERLQAEGVLTLPAFSHYGCGFIRLFLLRDMATIGYDCKLRACDLLIESRRQ